MEVDGLAKRWNHREGNEDYAQPRALFALMTADEKRRLFANMAGAMHGIPQFIIDRQHGHLEKVDPAYAAGVQTALASMSASRGANETEKAVDRMALDPAK
jgi:catalase